MNLSHLRYFLAVLETGSFTKGAERANVTQPTLSAAIKRIEEWLGAPIFQRGRQVALTPAGVRFAARARAILAEAGAARAECQADAPVQSLRIGWLKSLPFSRIAALLEDFGRQDPGLSLELVEGRSDALANLLRRGRLDAALTLLPTGSDRATSVPLFREPYVIAAGNGHPLARRVRCQIAELQNVPFVLRTDCEALPEARRLFDRHGVQPRVIHRTASDERALALVRIGLGLSLIPESLLCPGVTAIAVDRLQLHRQIAFCWREAAPEPSATLRGLALSQRWDAGDAPGQRLDIAH